MPPLLAAFLCAIYILWLFRRNSKTASGVSRALWIPTIWVAILASKPLAVWIAGGETQIDFNSYLEGSPIDRNFALVLIFFGMVTLARRGVQWGTVLRENRWLCLFYFYLLVSVIWSDYPFVAFKRWVRDAADVVMILVILTEENPVEAMRQVFVRCAYVLIPLSVLTMKYFIQIGRGYDFWTGTPILCGVTLGKNQLGRLALISGIFLLWNLAVVPRRGWYDKIKERWLEASVLGLCVMLLAKVNSATSLFCFGLGCFGFFAVRQPWIKANSNRLIWLGTLLISLSVLFLAVPDLRGIITGTLHRNVDLTERTDVWRGCLGLDTNPLIGAGFASVWLTPGAIALGDKLAVGEAHNGYLETYLNSGLIGLCLLLPVLLTAGKNTIRHISGGTAVGPLFAALLLIGLIYNYTEAAFDNGNLVGFILWLVVIQYPPSVREQDDYVTEAADESRLDEASPSSS